VSRSDNELVGRAKNPNRKVELEAEASRLLCRMQANVGMR